MENPIRLEVERFYSLDVLRGFAALSVVLWHWRHFFYHGSEPGAFDMQALPLFNLASLLYMKGWLAVDLFFGLSGFIFYWLYSERIATRRITPREFGVLRFSRLYPLYFLTLLLVALSQLFLLRSGNEEFVYQNNDLKHLILNLTFTSSWGLESGYSFNGPAWSVSTEVLLYLTFFVVCRKLPRNLAVPALLSLIGFTVLMKLHSPIGRGIGSFYLGGCVFLGYRAITASESRVQWEFVVYLGCLLVWLVTLLIGIDGFEYLRQQILEVRPMLGRIGGMTANNVHTIWIICVVFPATILSLALLEPRISAVTRRFAFIGDISYSSYLLHFPLQLAFHIFLIDSASPAIYYRPVLMALFFGLLISISLCSFHFFEMPMQRRIRDVARSRSADLADG